MTLKQALNDFEIKDIYWKEPNGTQHHISLEEVIRKPELLEKQGRIIMKETTHAENWDNTVGGLYFQFNEQV